MILSFEGKKSVDNILDMAHKCPYTLNISHDSFLIHGDNFDGLSMLLKSGYEGKIDLVYIDPPFNTDQTFYINRKRQSTISCPKSGPVAYNDKFSIEEYLEFIRERVILLHKLLSDQGCLYFHIDTKMGHYCKIILDEVFGRQNFKNDITRIKSNPKNFSRKAYGNEKDLILFYAKNHKNNIWNSVTEALTESEIEQRYTKKDENGWYTTIPLHAPGETTNGVTGQPWRGMLPPNGRHWRTNPEEFDKLDSQGLIEWSASGNPRIKKYAKDHRGKKIQDIWEYKDPPYPIYPTQKNRSLLERIILQSSNSDSIVLDCFAGSGTTLSVAQELGRKWIGMDNSKEAILIMQNQLSLEANQICVLGQNNIDIQTG